MSDSPEENWKLWTDRAKEDFELSKRSLRGKQPLTYGATFHAQQCIEKYLKALFVSRSIPFPKTHDLSALCVIAENNGILLPVSQDVLLELSTYAVETRYPGDTPTIEMAMDAFKYAELIQKFIRRILK